MLVVAIVILITFTLGFGLAWVQKNNSLADILWGLGFIVATTTALAVGGQATPRSWLLLGLVVIWGGRLSSHIYRRNHGKPEDFRYRQWREAWGEGWRLALRSYAQVFLLQGWLLLIIATPLIQTITRGNLAPAFPGWLDLLGIAVWCLGLGIEATADYQLARFKKNPSHKGQIMTEGLWHYSRHPNYFGEALLWWGIWLIALNVPGTAWTIIGPLTITILVRFVSGVPMLERKYAGRPDWERYKARTSAFFPWWPEDAASSSKKTLV